MPTVLAYTWAVVEEYGWASTAVTARGGRLSTSDRVRMAMRAGRSDEDREAQAEMLGRIRPHLESGRQMAPQIIAVLLSRLSDTVGYEADLAALLRDADTLPGPRLGLAVSAISVFARLAERDLAAETEAARGHGRPARIRRVGKVGQKVTLTGEVITMLKIDGFTRDSAPRMLLVLDCGTAVAKMATTAGWVATIQRGDTVTVEATVKAHQSYLGLPQTRLARPKLVDGPVRAGATPAAASAEEAPTPAWETVRQLPPQSRFQEVPLAAASPRPWHPNS